MLMTSTSSLRQGSAPAPGRQPSAMPSTLTPIEVALRHLDLGLGFAVFPLVPGGKAPLVPTGFHAATTDRDHAVAMWRYRRDANCGLRLPPDIVVLDVDGDVGRQSLAGRIVPVTVTIATPRPNGHHHYYKVPQLLGSRIGLLEGVDVKADGGYVVAAGSWSAQHARPWRGVPGLRFGEVDIAPAPDWLVEALLPRRVTAAAPVAVTSTSTRYAEVALENEASAVASTREGERNVKLNRSAFSLGTLVGAGHLDTETVTRALLTAARTAGLPDDEAAKTIQSGLAAGTRYPRVVSRG